MSAHGTMGLLRAAPSRVNRHHEAPRVSFAHALAWDRRRTDRPSDQAPALAHSFTYSFIAAAADLMPGSQRPSEKRPPCDNKVMDQTGRARALLRAGARQLTKRRQLTGSTSRRRASEREAS